MATKAHPSASLYVGDLQTDVTEGMLFDTFNRVGPVASIRVCRDTLTRRSLGYAYVNFHSVVDAERALDTLNNQAIRGKACRIMWSQRDPSVRKSGVGNIFIKNLDLSIGHKELHDTFSAFGNILSCKVATDEAGQSKGFGFVHFEGAEAANNAIKTVNEKLMGTKKVFVGKFESKKERQRRKESSWTNVYVKELDVKTTEEELSQQFGKFGLLSSVVIMRSDDASTSKGFGFVNFESHEDAVRAVDSLNGQKIGEKKIWCGPAQKKNEREAELKKKFYQLKMDRISRFQGTNLYIKNLEDEIDEERLRKEFSSFGTIRSAKIMSDDKGTSRGFGFICYTSPDEAHNAIVEMNNRILQGCYKPLYVALHEPKEVRRTKLAQRHSARKMRMNPTSVPPSIPYPQGVFYGNGNVTGFVYAPPPSQQQLLPRQRPPTWPQNPAFPNNAFPTPPPTRPTGGRNGGSRINAPQASNRVRGVNNPRRTQAPVTEHLGAGSVMDPRLHHVLSLPPDQQKLFMGEQLYPLIHSVEPTLAGKITGMLLDSGWGIEELYSLVIDETKLHNKIEEARNVLKRAQQTGELEDGDPSASAGIAGVGVGVPAEVNGRSDH